MVSKRKRAIEDFDPNKSDSEDENFNPDRDRPRRASKKARPSRVSRNNRKRSERYRGSDIDDNGEELSDSLEGSFVGESEEDVDAPVNPAGRRVRKAVISRQNYKESSEDEEEAELSEGNDDGGKKEEDDDEEEESAHRDLAQPSTENAKDSDVGKGAIKKIITLKVSPAAMRMQPPRRSTRASTAETDDFVELSTSGRHAVMTQNVRSKSPELYTRTRRSSRAMKGLKSAPLEPVETILEATQESSFHSLQDRDEPDELSNDFVRSPSQKKEEEVEASQEDVRTASPADAASVKDPADADASGGDEDEDVPLQRRTRASRTSIADAEEKLPEEAAENGSRRLTRGSCRKKSMAEPGSDFEPGDDSEEADMSASNKANDQDDDDSSTPRDRQKKRSARSSRRRNARADDDEGEEDCLDVDELNELNEEARELRQSSRARRRMRQESPIIYQEHARRSRAKVNYYMPPLTAANIEEDEEAADDHTATPSRPRRGKAGGGGGWDRNLNTTFGPFGGGAGGGSLLGGPWGTGAAGGADSDSSDDEMLHRSSMAGNVGMTPTSATLGGLLLGAQGLHAADGVGALPNVGKIKDRKALADADPLGVDLTVDFSKVGGLQGHIDQLKEMVQLPLLYPELFAKFHVTPPRGVLFHGPPGTGKTLLARALAHSVGSGGRRIAFYMRKGADALSKWVGEAEKQLRLLFEEARKTQPSIIFFDEIDGLAPVRSSKQEQIHASIVSTLLALMDGMDGRGQVIVIGATNRPDNIDPALRRPGRFDREFYFPLPDLDGRRAILNIHTDAWGLSPSFMGSLAERTKGYGGADLRALCTEAALNAIQRTYPQIYSSREKLLVDPDKITVHAFDFMSSIKNLTPSSERSATSGAQSLPRSIEPLLGVQLDEAKRILDELLPRKKKLTALEEALFEQFDDDDHSFGREYLHQEFERSRIFRPRFLVCGAPGMGQGYIASALLHYLEGVRVQNFDLPSLLADGRPTEQVIVGLFAEVRRQKPSVIYIPNIDDWYATLSGTIALITFQTMLKSLPPTDPVLLFATSESKPDAEERRLSPSERDFFGYSRKNQLEIARPGREHRMTFFATTLDYIKKKPAEFPDPENRKKRVLEQLPIAPTSSPKAPTKAEMKAQKKRDHQLLNGLKIQLQPIMDQINRRYKKFRQPVIPHSQIGYLFAEADPNYVRADIVDDSLRRQFEIVKDKYGNDVLKDTTTEKCYFNLETTTIEERLSNGFYARPRDFLFDIKALAKDARNIGDKERTLKANEMLSNVEVDVASIESSTAHIDWEMLYRRQAQRAKSVVEREQKRRAFQSMTDRIQAEQGAANDSDSQGPLTLGVAVPGSRSAARFRLRSPLSNGSLTKGQQEPGPLAIVSLDLLNPSATHEDVRMGGIGGDGNDDDKDESRPEETTQASSAMGPPPNPEDWSTRAHTGMTTTQVSQRSAVTSLPTGVSPSAVLNEASTTKTSDQSTHRSSNWSTQLTNGFPPIRERPDGGEREHEHEAVERARSSQRTSSDEVWPHSQAQNLAHHGNAAGPGTNPAGGSGSLLSSQSQAQQGSGGGGSGEAAAAAGHNTQASEESQARNSGQTGSQTLSVEGAMENFLQEVTEATADCTIEQLEQINRELMDAIWRSRHEWNRLKVLGFVTGVFNDTIAEIEAMQAMDLLSQRRSLE